MKHHARMSMLFLCALNLTTLSTSLSLTPQDTVILSDLDGVLLTRDWKIIPEIVYQGVSTTVLHLWAGKEYFSTVWDFISVYKKGTTLKNDCNIDTNNKINSVTFTLLYVGVTRSISYPFVFESLMKSLNASHTFIEGTREIYRYLKKKGYTIDYATNKDRLSYDIVAAKLGDKLQSLPHAIFVAQPGNGRSVIELLTKAFNQGSTLPFLEYALFVQPSDSIYHAPNKKPCAQYYQYVIELIGKNKNIIFIDDIQKNVDGFNALNTADKRLHGILFKDPAQLVNNLIQLGILSEQDDRAFIDHICYQGVWGTLMQWYCQLRDFIFKPAF